MKPVRISKVVKSAGVPKKSKQPVPQRNVNKPTSPKGYSKGY